MVAFLIVLLTGVLVAGCGSEDAASPTAPTTRPPASGDDAPGPAAEPPSAEDLWGRTFISAAVTENGEPRPLVQGTHIRLGFRRSEARQWMAWKAGCNSAGAKVRITGEELHTGPIASTLIGCPADLEQQDEWLFDFFRADPKWRLRDHRLTLSSDTTVIELEARTVM